MRIAELLEKRRQGWLELERMCDLLQKAQFPFSRQGAQVAKFSSLYRAACTDLSMAEQYQLPPATVEYLHRLVGRAHSQLRQTKNCDEPHQSRACDFSASCYFAIDLGFTGRRYSVHASSANQNRKLGVLLHHLDADTV